MSAVPASSRPAAPAAALRHARRLLGRHPVIDGHNDLPWTIRNDAKAPGDVAAYDLRRRTRGDTDLARLKAGGVGGQFWSVYIPGDLEGGRFARTQLEQIDIARRVIERYPDRLQPAFSAADVEQARRRGRIASLLGIEGGHAIEGSLGALRAYYDLGVRYMTLTHNVTLDWADSCNDVRRHGGLTDFGRDVVREMNRLGMLVDLAHTSPEVMGHALDVADAPLISSHSSCRALTDHPRNMDDKMLRAMGQNGGVVMVNFFSSFIDDNFRKAYAAQSAERAAATKKAEDDWKAAHPGEPVPYEVSDKVGKEWAAEVPRPPLKSLIDHIDHIAKTAGIDHVGLGSDFDGVSSLPEGIDSAADLPKITAGLMKRGYTANDMKKILGGNIMRVFREVEQMRDQMAAEGEQAPLLKKKDAK